MNDISIPVSIPLDPEGFLRRECPNCQQEFKWYVTDDGSAEPVNQYFCPLCGQPAGLDSWWTPAQLEYARGAAAPAIDEFVDQSLDDVFKSLKSSKNIKVKKTGSYSSGTPVPAPLHDPCDMVIAVPPCHPEEPVKVPETALARIHCLICGEPFAV